MRLHLGRELNISLRTEDKSAITTDTETENFVNEIMNIELSDKSDFPLDNLNINEKISEENKSKIRNIFARQYLEPKRPVEPKVNEISLLIKEHQPFHFSPRRLSYFEKESVWKILDDLLEKNVIRPSNSEYASPIVLVKKKNNECRLCVDYGTLNKSLIKDNYPLPLVIEDQLDVLNNK